MKIRLLGNCTVVLETEHSRIMLDPYFGKFGNILYRRCKVGANYEAGGRKLDAILLSHGHWDHMDLGFVMKHKAETAVYAPWNSLKRWLVGAKGISKGNSFQVGDFKITPVQAWHFCPAVGYMIEAEGETVYFSGDTFYGKFMKELGQTFDVKVALIGVTQYMVPMTMGSAGTCKALQDLSAEVFIPMHQDILPMLQLDNRATLLKKVQMKIEKDKIGVHMMVLENGGTYDTKKG